MFWGPDFAGDCMKELKFQKRKLLDHVATRHCLKQCLNKRWA